MNNQVLISQVLVAGLVRLIKGQCQFAMEFGLSVERVFPGLADMVQSQKLEELVAAWLSGDNVQSTIKLEQLMSALIDHQLALLAALDGVTLQTLAEFPIWCRPYRQIHTCLAALRRSLQACRRIQRLRGNPELRYQQLIVPGFISRYMQWRENEKLSGKQ